MGTELVKHVDTIKEMSALEAAWHNLPSANMPHFKSSLEQVEEGYMSGLYFSSVLATLAVVPSTAVAFMTGFDSLADFIAVFLTLGATPVGVVLLEVLHKKDHSLFGMLDTRILRRKKYRVLYEKEVLEHAESMNEYKKKHKKREKAKKKLMLEAERISFEADGKMVFSNGKFSPAKEGEKEQVILSARERELMSQFTKQIEVGS